MSNQSTWGSDEWFPKTQQPGWLLPLGAGWLELPVQAATKSAALSLSFKMIHETETDKLPQTLFFTLQSRKMEAAA